MKFWMEADVQGFKPADSLADGTGFFFHAPFNGATGRKRIERMAPWNMDRKNHNALGVDFALAFHAK